METKSAQIKIIKIVHITINNMIKIFVFKIVQI